MPKLMRVLTTVGTAAMLWVGGSIIVHGLDVLGWPWLYDSIHALAVAAADRVPGAAAFVEWAVTAFCDGVVGLLLGLPLIPVVTRALNPMINALRGRKNVAP